MSAVRSEHDPLCPSLTVPAEKWAEAQLMCRCRLIAQVRDDEALHWHCAMPCCDEDDE